jgi:hypothetical protein
MRKKESNSVACSLSWNWVELMYYSATFHIQTRLRVVEWTCTETMHFQKERLKSGNRTSGISKKRAKMNQSKETGCKDVEESARSAVECRREAEGEDGSVRDNVVMLRGGVVFGRNVMTRDKRPRLTVTSDLAESS